VSGQVTGIEDTLRYLGTFLQAKKSPDQLRSGLDTTF
jgi:hypothetical protein